MTRHRRVSVTLRCGTIGAGCSRGSGGGLTVAAVAERPDASGASCELGSESGAPPVGGITPRYSFGFATPSMIVRVIAGKLPSPQNPLPLVKSGPRGVPVALQPWHGSQVPPPGNGRRARRARPGQGSLWRGRQGGCVRGARTRMDAFRRFRPLAGHLREVLVSPIIAVASYTETRSGYELPAGNWHPELPKAAPRASA
jgi:hypothetical protein